MLAFNYWKLSFRTSRRYAYKSAYIYGRTRSQAVRPPKRGWMRPKGLILERFRQHCTRCAHPHSGGMRACAAGGHPSCTPPAHATIPCMPHRRTIRQGRQSSPRPDCPTNPVHARKSCNIDLCISATTRHIVALCSAGSMRSRAHSPANPLSSRRERVHSRQGERGHAIGAQGRGWGMRAIAIVRAGAQERKRSLPPLPTPPSGASAMVWRGL